MAELDTIKLDRACFEVENENDHKSLVLAGDNLEVLECQECGWERMRTAAEMAADKRPTLSANDLRGRNWPEALLAPGALGPRRNPLARDPAAPVAGAVKRMRKGR